MDEKDRLKHLELDKHKCERIIPVEIENIFNPADPEHVRLVQKNLRKVTNDYLNFLRSEHQRANLESAKE